MMVFSLLRRSVDDETIAADPRRSRHGQTVDLGEGGIHVDGAWLLWERLHGWGQRCAVEVDAAWAIGLFLICSGWFIQASRTPHLNIAIVAGLTLPLILRRRFPAGVFIVLCMVALFQWFTSGPLLADTALLVALYSVAVASEWILVVVAALVLEIGVLLATVHWALVGSNFKSLVLLTGMVFAALLAGIVIRALRSQMFSLAERARRLERERDQQASLAAAAERARIAREMHDVVTHNIQVMVTLADAADVALRLEPQRALEAIREVSGTGRQALNDMRRLLGVLRDDNADTNFGVKGHPRPSMDSFAPQPGLRELNALVNRVNTTGLAVTLCETGEPFEVSEAAGLTVYRIVQEALTNTLKHAATARSARVTLGFSDPELTVKVVDDGLVNPHADVTAASRANVGGHGVAGMTERAAAFGGTLTAGPHTNEGWQVAATLHGCKAQVHS
jgi:signal transduction histidine kinase